MVLKQINIFGEEEDIQDIVSKEKKSKLLSGGRIPLKSKFRYNYGYKNNLYCKNCKYFHKYDYHDKKYFKCEKLGFSNSSATDIRKNDIACNLYNDNLTN